MLTQADLFRTAKRELGLPFVEFEKTDDELLDILQSKTMLTWNRYFPDVRTMTLDTADTNIQTDVPNVFWLQDPDNREIHSVSKVYPQEGDMFIHDYPIDVAFRRFDELPEWVLAVDRAETAYMHSPAYITFDFIPPSQIRIKPVQQASTQYYTIRYERDNAIDLSTIPAQYEHFLRKLFLADVKIELGRIRKKYSTIGTPFGEINVDGDTVLSEGRDDRKELEDLFEERALPNVIVRTG